MLACKNLGHWGLGGGSYGRGRSGKGRTTQIANAFVPQEAVLASPEEAEVVPVLLLLYTFTYITHDIPPIGYPDRGARTRLRIPPLF